MMGSGNGGTPVTPHLPKSLLHLLGPCSFWLVPLEPAVIRSFEQGQVCSPGPGQEGARPASHHGRKAAGHNPGDPPSGPRPPPLSLTLPPRLCNHCVTSFSLNISFSPPPEPHRNPTIFFSISFFPLFLFFEKLILSLSCHKITSENTTSLQKRSRMTQTLRKTHFYGLWKHL